MSSGRFYDIRTLFPHVYKRQVTHVRSPYPRIQSFKGELIHFQGQLTFSKLFISLLNKGSERGSKFFLWRGSFSKELVGWKASRKLQKIDPHPLPALVWNGGKCIKWILSLSLKQHFSQRTTKPTKWYQPSLIRVFAVRSVDPSFLHKDSTLWSDSADAQSDLSLQWSHKPLQVLSCAGSFCIDQSDYWESMWTHFIHIVIGRRTIERWSNQHTTKPTNGMCTQRRLQLSLDVRPVWSASSMCAQWVAKGPSLLHADSEYSDQSGRMPRLIWVSAGRTYHFVGFVVRWLNFYFDQSDNRGSKDKFCSHSDRKKKDWDMISDMIFLGYRL